MADPPLLAGAVNATEADPFPGVTVPIVGAPGGVLYVSAAGSESDPLLDGASVTGPNDAGVIVKVCAAEDPL